MPRRPRNRQRICAAARELRERVARTVGHGLCVEIEVRRPINPAIGRNAERLERHPAGSRIAVERLNRPLLAERERGERSRIKRGGHAELRRKLSAALDAGLLALDRGALRRVADESVLLGRQVDALVAAVGAPLGDVVCARYLPRAAIERVNTGSRRERPCRIVRLVELDVDPADRLAAEDTPFCDRLVGSTLINDKAVTRHETDGNRE